MVRITREDIETIVCVNNHHTSLPKGSTIRERMFESRESYVNFVCPVCKAKGCAVLCANPTCGECVSPFSPCCKCGKRLVSSGMCSNPKC